MPVDAESSVHGLGMWDVAYVLGSLSNADRREFEAHIADCKSCRDAVAEVSGMPGLLSRLSHDDVAVIGACDASGGASLTPNLLPSLLAQVNWRRRRSRVITWVASGAAAVMLVIGALCAVQVHSASSVPAPPQARVLAPPGPQLNITNWPQQSREHLFASATSAAGGSS